MNSINYKLWSKKILIDMPFDEIKNEFDNRNYYVKNTYLWPCRVFTVTIPNSFEDPFENLLNNFYKINETNLDYISEKTKLNKSFLESVKLKIDGIEPTNENIQPYQILYGIQDAKSGHILPYFYESELEFVLIEKNHKEKCWFYIDDKYIKSIIMEPSKEKLPLSKNTVLISLQQFDPKFNKISPDQIECGIYTQKVYLNTFQFSEKNNSKRMFFTNGLNSKISTSILTSYIKSTTKDLPINNKFLFKKLNKTEKTETVETHLDYLFKSAINNDSNNEYQEFCKKCYTKFIYEQIETILSKAYLNNKITKDKNEAFKQLCNDKNTMRELQNEFYFDKPLNISFYHLNNKNNKNVEQYEMLTVLQLLMLGTKLNDKDNPDCYRFKLLINNNDQFINQLFSLKQIRDSIKHQNTIEINFWDNPNKIKDYLLLIKSCNEILLNNTHNVEKNEIFSDYSQKELINNIINNLGNNFFQYSDNLMNSLISLEKALQDNNTYKIFDELYKITTIILEKELSKEANLLALVQFSIYDLENLPDYLIKIRKSNLSKLKTGNLKTSLGTLFLGYLWLNKENEDYKTKYLNTDIELLYKIITNRGHGSHRLELKQSDCIKSIEEIYNFIKRLQ